MVSALGGTRTPNLLIRSQCSIKFGFGTKEKCIDSTLKVLLTIRYQKSVHEGIKAGDVYFEDNVKSGLFIPSFGTFVPFPFLSPLLRDKFVSALSTQKFVL